MRYHSAVHRELYVVSPFKTKVPQLSLRKPSYHWVARDEQWAEKAETWHSCGTHMPGLLLGVVVPGPTTLQQRRHSQLWAVQLLQPLSF